MGINGINKLIRRFAPNGSFNLSIDKLTGKRVAIDASGWMYANICICRGKIVKRTNLMLEDPDPNEIKREWFLAALNFILSWLSHNITPVFVFDGIPPPEKEITKEDRRAKKLAAEEKINELTKQLRNNSDNQQQIMVDLKKQLCNYNYIPKEYFELFETVIKGFGIPCLKAIGEAEQLCSILCQEGKVAAVFSADSDSLVYGCPLVINSRTEGFTYDENGNKIISFECMRLDTILEEMKITHSFFVDLCIMSGCDFNKNMKGYAAIKSLDLLRKHGSIENLPKNLDITCLNHVRCREIFKYVESDKLSKDLISLDINTFAIGDMGKYFHMAGISSYMNRLIIAYQQMKSSSDGLIEELRIILVPKYVPPIFLNLNPVINNSKYLTLKIMS